MKQFIRLLINTIIAGTTASFLWFGLTFWIYLETKNVMATAILGGTYMVMLALTGILFGTLVDKHKKKLVVVMASIISLVAYILSGAVFLLAPAESITEIGNIWFWVLTILVLIGTVIVNIRGIALATCVTIMVPEEKRVKANGLVGMFQGLSFMVTSIFSGLAIGYLGMGWTIAITIIFALFVLFDLFFVTINEDHIVHDSNILTNIDIKGAWSAVRIAPGLFGLIIFSTFNNFFGGVFMSLLDPYGLTLTDVKIWGLVYALSSVGFIIGGIIVMKFGLTSKPLRLLIVVNLLMSIIGIVMGIRELLWLLAVSMFAYMAIIPIAEAAEQTVLQKVVPIAKQGRVFGFSSSVESLAAPVTAFLVGPLAQYVFIPYMTTAEGSNKWAWLVGQGEARGIALIFIASSICMIIVGLVAFRSKSYKMLSTQYSNTIK